MILSRVCSFMSSHKKKERRRERRKKQGAKCDKKKDVGDQKSGWQKKIEGRQKGGVTGECLSIDSRQTGKARKRGNWTNGPSSPHSSPVQRFFVSSSPFQTPVNYHTPPLPSSTAEMVFFGHFTKVLSESACFRPPPQQVEFIVDVLPR